MGAPTTTPTERIAALMHQGKYKQAYWLGKDLSDSGVALDVDFRYQHLLAGLLVFGPDGLQVLINRLYATDGITDTMKGDVQRDLALALIRRGAPHDLIIAEHRLSGAAALYAVDDDVNRLIAVTAAYGRLDFAQGKYYSAYTNMYQADRQWNLHSDADPVYVRNNRFQLFRAQVALSFHASFVHEALLRFEEKRHGRPHNQNRQQLYREFTDPALEPNATRRLRARLLHLFGHHWIPVDRWLEQRR